MSDPMPSPVVRVVLQREPADCAIACLAMATGASYEDALRAAVAVDRCLGKRGLWLGQIQRAADLLGVTLRRKRKPDIENDSGILQVHLAEDTADHVVYLIDGRIIETNGTIWEPEAYFENRKGKASPGTLLTTETA